MNKGNNPQKNKNVQLSSDERIVNRTNQRRKKNRRKKLIIRTSLCAAFLIVGTILAMTLFFNVDEITVTGDTIYSDKEVIASSDIEIGDNLIFLSKAKINEKITYELPYVGQVKIKRHLPSSVELQLEKSDAVYAVVKDGCYTVLDKNGKVLEKSLETVGESTILVNIGNINTLEPGKRVEVEEERLLEKLFEVSEACLKVGLTDITSMDLSDFYNIKLVYQGRITLELGETNKENLTKKLDFGKATIEKQNEENDLYRGTINLTVDGKGYWSEEVSTTEPPVTEEPTQEVTESQENDDNKPTENQQSAE